MIKFLRIPHRLYALLCLQLCTLFVQAQTTELYHWSNVAMGGGGFVSGIVTSKTQPGLIYARTDVGGAYRWDVANNQWIPLLDFASESQQGYMGVLSVAIDSKNPSNVYMAVGISYFNNGNSYLLRSADYGAHFTSVDVTAQFKINGNANGREDGERLQVDPVNPSILYCGSQSNGLFKSNNSASTWTNMPGLSVTTTNNGNGVNFVVLDTSSIATVNGSPQTQRMFVGVSTAGNNLYRSDDGGTTFVPIAPPNPLDATLMPHRAVLGNGNLYVTYTNGGGPGTISNAEPCNEGQIWKYNVATALWTNITPVVAGNPLNDPWCGISIDPGNANRLIVSTTNHYSVQYLGGSGNVYGDRIFLTTDGGSNWTDIVSRGFSLNANGQPWINGQSIHWGGSIQFDPSNTNRVLINSGNGLFVNNDITNVAGVWNFTVKGMEETVPRNMVSINGGGPLISVISDYDGFTQANPAVYAANRHLPSMGSTDGLDYAVSSKKVVRAGSSMYYSNDLGVTWTKTNMINGGGGQAAVSADGNVILHCPAGSTVTYRSVDNGSSWTGSGGLNVNTRPVADGFNPNKFYAYDGSTGNLYTSIDGGISFAAAPNTTGTYGSSVIRTIPGREGSVWIALLNGGLVYTDDGAATPFRKIANVTNCEAVGIGKADSSGGYETIYIWGTVNSVLGVHRSIDKGVSWTRVNDDDHQYGGPANGQFVQGDMNVYGRVYLSTAGRGIAYGSVIPTLTVVPDSLHYRPADSSQVVTITSNQNWTVSSSQSWLTASALSGLNSDTLALHVTANTGSVTRTGTITLTGGGITRTIVVTQTFVADTLSASVGKRIFIFPNPIVENQLTMHFNNMPSGTYAVTFLSVLGQVLQNKMIQYDGLATIQHLPMNYSTGIYILYIHGFLFEQTERIIVR